MNETPWEQNATYMIGNDFRKLRRDFRRRPPVSSKKQPSIDTSEKNAATYNVFEFLDGVYGTVKKLYKSITPMRLTQAGMAIAIGTYAGGEIVKKMEQMDDAAFAKYIHITGIDVNKFLGGSHDGLPSIAPKGGERYNPGKVSKDAKKYGGGGLVMVAGAASDFNYKPGGGELPSAPTDDKIDVIKWFYNVGTGIGEEIGGWYNAIEKLMGWSKDVAKTGKIVSDTGGKMTDAQKIELCNGYGGPGDVVKDGICLDGAGNNIYDKTVAKKRNNEIAGADKKTESEPAVVKGVGTTEKGAVNQKQNTQGKQSIVTGNDGITADWTSFIKIERNCDTFKTKGYETCSVHFGRPVGGDDFYALISVKGKSPEAITVRMYDRNSKRKLAPIIYDIDIKNGELEQIERALKIRKPALTIVQPSDEEQQIQLYIQHGFQDIGPLDILVAELGTNGEVVTSLAEFSADEMYQALS